MAFRSNSRPSKDGDDDYGFYDYSRQGYLYGGSEVEASQQQQIQPEQQSTCEYSSQIQYHQYPPIPLYAGQTCPLCSAVLDHDQVGPCIKQYCTIPYQMPKPPPSNFFEKNPCGRNPFEKPGTAAAPAGPDSTNAGQDSKFGFKSYYSQDKPYPAFTMQVYDQHGIINQQPSATPPATSPPPQESHAASGRPSVDNYDHLVHQMMNDAADQSCQCNPCKCTLNEGKAGNSQNPAASQSPPSVSKSNQNAEKSSISSVTKNSTQQNGSLKFEPNLENDLQNADGSLAGSETKSKVSSTSAPKSEGKRDTTSSQDRAEADRIHSFTHVPHDYEGPGEDYIDGDEEDSSLGSSNISISTYGSGSTLGDDKSSKGSKTLKNSKKSKK